MYHIYSADAIKRISHLNTLPFTEARYLNGDIGGNACTLICHDIVAIQIFSQMFDEKPKTTLIKNDQLADVYRNYFLMLWKQAIVP